MSLKSNFLILSAHDFRTPRKSNIHFIAESLAKNGLTRFFSLRYSFLSQFKNDFRRSVDTLANSVTRYRGVDCFLWKVPIHPFNTRSRYFNFLEEWAFQCYAKNFPKILKQWICDSHYIIFESGTSIIFIELARRLNPKAKLIYLASDLLDTINSAQFVCKTFSRVCLMLDVIAITSTKMLDAIPVRDNVYYVPHGIDRSLHQLGNSSPYSDGVHAVSVGSMLFDADFFLIAASLFENVTFHVIGCGKKKLPSFPSNVIVKGEMDFSETIRYIKHATFGIAPYHCCELPSYLADTSMKLLQYDFFGLPSVCPVLVAGDYSSRFGYIPGDALSISSAISHAIASPRFCGRQCLSWDESTERLIHPERFDSTRRFLVA